MLQLVKVIRAMQNLGTTAGDRIFMLIVILEEFNSVITFDSI